MGGMSDMLLRKNVQIVESVSSWEEAVQVAVTPLVDQGFAEKRYIDGIISNARELGPYFVICPDLALLHARPEQGAIHSQLAATVLRQPVRFKEEGPDVRLLITLVAEDANGHIEVMRQIATLFGDPANIERAATPATADELYELLCSSPS